MRLTETETDKLLKVADILAGQGAMRKLRETGINIGDLIYKINGKNGGPVTVIKEKGTAHRLIIGKGLASKIIVEFN